MPKKREGPDLRSSHPDLHDELYDSLVLALLLGEGGMQHARKLMKKALTEWCKANPTEALTLTGSPDEIVAPYLEMRAGRLISLEYGKEHDRLPDGQVLGYPEGDSGASQ